MGVADMNLECQIDNHQTGRVSMHGTLGWWGSAESFQDLPQNYTEWIMSWAVTNTAELGKWNWALQENSNGTKILTPRLFQKSSITDTHSCSIPATDL